MNFLIKILRKKSKNLHKNFLIFKQEKINFQLEYKEKLLNIRLLIENLIFKRNSSQFLIISIFFEK